MAYSRNSAKFVITLAKTLLMLLCSSSFSKSSQLYPNFYEKTCPKLLRIVKENVDKYVGRENRMGASLLRMHFHDCFVNGCDGSILLKGKQGEQDAPSNANSIRGYEVIEDIKIAVESVCKNTVSCADILALTARESVVFLKGPSWDLGFGRRDSRRSSIEDVKTSNLPFPSDDLDVLAEKFRKLGFTMDELVTLSGAHTIGQARCTNFRSRIYNEKNIDKTFAEGARRHCPEVLGDDNLEALDIQTPKVFDNSYYENLFRQQGLLHSDQQLYGGNTKSFVDKYRQDPKLFENDFAAAMLKMSELSPLLGNEGEIRKICSQTN